MTSFLQRLKYRTILAAAFIFFAAAHLSAQEVAHSGTVAENLLKVKVVFLPENVAAANTSSSTMDRVGVQAAQPLALSLNEAVQRALKNNNDIEMSRSDVRIAETTVRSRLGIYDPTFSFSPTLSHSQTTGGAGTNDLRTSAGLNQFIRPGGGSFNTFFNNNRTENAFAQAQASSGGLSGGSGAIYTSSLGVSYTQPLARNFNIDSKRYAIKIAKKQLAQSDSDFRSKAINTIAATQRAYWNLVFALRDQQNQSDNLELSRENLRQIEARIAAGAAAPLDKAEVDTELATREGNLLLATQQVTVAENALKQLIFGDPISPDWERSIVPTDKPAFSTDTVSLDAAMKDAMDNRFELRRLKLAREINAIDIKYLRNQTLPQIDLNTQFSLNGLSQSGSSSAFTTNLFTSTGDLFLLNGINTTRSFVGLPVLANPSFVVPASPAYLYGGFGRSLSNIFRSDAPNYSIGVTISFPFRNRTAKADLEAAKITSERLAAQTRSQEQAIIVDVRNAVQAVETGRKRVLTARRARQSAEVQLDGERKLYEAGRSTTFLLFQRENALANARTAEIRAETDYISAIEALQQVTATTFRENNITLDSPVEIK
ncbi:MAG: TolC family protein [Chloracidobacterium sp.]|nr:TolC family protein [Chloracidobacterium sp.]MCO5332614.1 TolC family protein [Pyrinomonadaceae bacterium]